MAADTWAQEMANQFKKRDNPKPISNCIGLILQTGDDWKVSIQNGAYIIDKRNGYICRHILQRASDFTIDSESLSGSLTTGSCTGGYKHSGSSYSTSNTATGHVTLHPIDDWKPGNKVMVAPTADNQRFFIVDIIV